MQPMINATIPPGPLTLSAEHPHFFSDGTGKAVFLGGAHTWAYSQERGVEGETPPFDHHAYLDVLVSAGHNCLRVWTWEHAQWMQFTSRDVPVRYTPNAYERTGPGNALDGKPKFDLTTFNETYFERLRRRVEDAGRRGLYTIVMIFQGFSVSQTRGDDTRGNAWHGHPFNKHNNINGIDGDPDGSDTGYAVHRLDVPEIVRLREAYVRKVIDTLNDFDFILWEIGNELHEKSIPLQYHMIEFVREYEKTKPKRHLIGMTGAPIKTPELVASPADWISPYNKGHFDDPPIIAQKACITDTDHGRSSSTDSALVWKCFTRGQHFLLMDWYQDYRSHLDGLVSRDWDTVRHSIGRAVQLSREIDLAHMAPLPDMSSTRYCLANPGSEYVVYQPDASSPVDLNLPDGRYVGTWLDPDTGKRVPQAPITSNGRISMHPPSFERHAVLHLL